MIKKIKKETVIALAVGILMTFIYVTYNLGYKHGKADTHIIEVIQNKRSN
jgi:hypothetical protein